MRILCIQNISNKTLLYAYPRYSKRLVVKLYYMHILGKQNISSKTLLYAYTWYSNH